jgi:hypothetical protein
MIIIYNIIKIDFLNYEFKFKKMKNYSSRINKIKDTLGEIKNNIKKFQLVNNILFLYNYFLFFSQKEKH